MAKRACRQEAESSPKFLNEAQHAAWQMLEKHEIALLVGSAGTGKTHLAVSYAIQEVRAKRYDRVIMTRAVIEAGRSKLGSLPGEVSCKIAPYARAANEVVKKLRATDIPIEFIPPCFLQGLTLDHAVVVADEAQALTVEELKLVVGRLGRHSRLIICGDPAQDLNRTQHSLSRFLAAVEPLEGIGVHRFAAENIVRHHLIGRVLAATESI